MAALGGGVDVDREVEVVVVVCVEVGCEATTTSLVALSIDRLTLPIH